MEIDIFCFWQLFAPNKHISMHMRSDNVNIYFQKSIEPFDNILTPIAVLLVTLMTSCHH